MGRTARHRVISRCRDTTQRPSKHYFRPWREDFKQRILAAMPSLLAGPTEIKSVGAGDASAKLEAALDGLGKEELERVAARAKELQQTC